MDASEFVTAVARSAPILEQLMAQGLSAEEARVLRSSFMACPLSVQRPVPSGLAEIGDLFAAYDPSSLTIGMVTFSALPVFRDIGVIIGKVEADLLVVDSKIGEVRVVEFGTRGHCLWKCGNSPGAFLGALAAASRILAGCACAEVEYSEVPYAEVERCAELAGGQGYADFYRMLLGSY